MESSKVETELQMRSADQNRGFPLFGIYNFLCPAGCVLAHVGQNAIILLCAGALLTRVPSLVHQHLHVLFCKAALYPVNIQLMLLRGSYSILVAWLCICLQVSASPILQAIEDPLNDRQPCPPAYQPVLPNLMSYIMSYSQEWMYILSGGRKFIHLHLEFWR